MLLRRIVVGIARSKLATTVICVSSWFILSVLSALIGNKIKTPYTKIKGNESFIFSKKFGWLISAKAKLNQAYTIMLAAKINGVITDKTRFLSFLASKIELNIMPKTKTLLEYIE